MSTPTIETTTASRAWDAAPATHEARIPAPADYRSRPAQLPLRTESEPRRTRDHSAWRRVDPFRWVSHRREHVGLSAPDDL